MGCLLPMGGASMNIVVHPGRLRLEMARRGWDGSTLAREAGVSAPTVGAALSGRPITPQSLTRIAQALARVPVVDVIDSLLMNDVDDRGIA